MNEELPPPYDPANQPPQPPPSLPPGAPQPPSFWGMVGLGVLVLVISCLLCGAIGNPVPLGLGFLIALGSLFFTGYRGIFIGFAGAVGIISLIAAIACGAILATGGLGDMK